MECGLFWFTHEAHYLDQPERVLEAVWQKARNDTWRPLLGEKGQTQHVRSQGQ